MMSRKPLIAVVAKVFLVIAIAGCLLGAGCRPTVSKIRFGVETSILSAPVWVAEMKGYFQTEGLEVEIKEFDSGRTAFRTMLDADGLDIVTVAPTPIILSSFGRNDYAVIAVMTYTDNDSKVVARQDRGITKPVDLKGKIIGVTKGSTGHFFLSSFLNSIGLTNSDVELVDMKATEMAQALAEGRVDAISTWEPHIFNAQKLLGKNVMLFEDNGLFREHFSLVASRNFIKEHANILERFLRALEKAEKFININREESINIVATRIGADINLVDKLWNDFEFNLRLDQSILINLEDRARWSISNKLTEAQKEPDYLDFIYPDALKSVKPGAVTIPGK